MSFSSSLPPAHRCSGSHVHLRGIIAQCESKIKSFQGIHTAINRTEFAEHLKKIAKTCTWGTNLEIIVTVASDSYRPGKPTWLKYSPNTLATAELHNSSVRDLRSKFPILSHKQNLWLEIAHVSRYFDAISQLPLVIYADQS